MTTEPADVPFERAASTVNLAPRKRPAHAPDPVISRRNRGNKQRGRRAETEWAALIGGVRVGILGHEDVDDRMRSWEVKSRRLPTWLRDAMAQAVRNAGRRIPAVAVRDARQGVPASWLVVLRADDFIELCGRGERQ